MYLPSYRIGEAAHYANVAAQTVAAWHKPGARAGHTLSAKDAGAELSYMQLIEVAVVAAFRQAGVSLQKIRAAREYVSSSLHSEFPFAEYRFKSDGKKLWMDYQQVEGKKGKNKLLGVNQGGQLAWSEVMGRLKEFEYDKGRIVVRWKVAGARSPVVIDPRVSFGAPTVHGTPTWVIRGRWEAGESLEDIADDFGLKKDDVQKALDFENVPTDRQRAWMN